MPTRVLLEVVEPIYFGRSGPEAADDEQYVEACHDRALPPQNLVQLPMVDVSALGAKLAYPGASAQRTGQQLVNALPNDSAPRHVIGDRDKIHGAHFVRRVRAMGIEQALTAPRSPWRNPYCERAISTLRRDCLVQVIALPMVGGLHHRYTRRTA